MTRILIAYGTCEGHTARITGCVADILREHGLAVVAVDAKRPGALDLLSFDAVIVGASVHMGTHQKYVRDFVRRHRHELDRLPSAFFSVSLGAHDPSEAAREEVNEYVERFVQETGWRPDMTAAFAGALLYTRYGFLTRWIMKRIVQSKGGTDTDTSRDYVYTDWEQVRRYTEEFRHLAVPEIVAGTAAGRDAGDGPGCYAEPAGPGFQPRSATASRAMRRASSVGIT